MLKLARALQAETHVSERSLIMIPPDEGHDTRHPSGEISTRIKAEFSRIRSWLQTRHPHAAAEIHNYLETTAQRLDIPAAVTGEETATDEGEGDLGELSPEHEVHNLANEMYKEGHYDLARDAYTAALQLCPDLLETLFNRSLSWTRLREYDRAHRDMSRVLDLNPDLEEGYYTRGLINEYRGDLDAALADYERSLAIKGDYTKASEQRQKLKGKMTRRSRGEEENSSGSSREDGVIKDFSRYLEKPRSSLRTIGGNRRAKRELRKIVAYLKGSSLLRDFGLPLPTGVLLDGEPGTGKTSLIEALGGEVKCPFYHLSASVFLNLWYGSTEASIRGLFAEARSHGTAVVFLDEFDSIGCRRSDLSQGRESDCHDRTVSCLLDEMSRLSRGDGERVVVLGATSRFSAVDDAFKRPGRFTYCIHVPVPGFDDLLEIWKVQLEQHEDRAERIDLFSPDLRDVITTPMANWLAASKEQRSSKFDGLVRLITLSAEHRFVGDDVREIIRRAIDERVYRIMEDVPDPGAISVDQLHQQLNTYLAERSRVRDDRAVA
jgi:SpoVK/Ycf46/Vps4 family AAA+-type ATPase